MIDLLHVLFLHHGSCRTNVIQIHDQPLLKLFDIPAFSVLTDELTSVKFQLMTEMLVAGLSFKILSVVMIDQLQNLTKVTR